MPRPPDRAHRLQAETRRDLALRRRDSRSGGRPGESLPHLARQTGPAAQGQPRHHPDTNVELHAWGLTSADSIVAAWAASPEHRISILDDFDKIITCGYWTMPDGTNGPYAACTLG